MPKGSNILYYDFKDLEKIVKRLCSKIKCLEANDEFGITTLSPPIDAPGTGDPLVLINLTTGVIYFWDGDSWEVASGDTHMGNTDLVFTGSRTYTGNGNIVYNGVSYWNLNTIGASGIKLLNDNGAGDSSVVEITPSRLDINTYAGGSVVGTFILGPLGSVWGDASGMYYLGDGFFTLPPTLSDVTPDSGLAMNSADGRIYRTTKPVIPTDLDNLKKDQIGILIDGGGAEITTGYKGRFRVPYSGTITGWTILEVSETPITSSIVVDVKLGTYANYDTTPTFASIAGSEKPTITTSEKGQDNTLTTWTVAVTAGDLIEYTVDSVTDAEKVQLFIDITKS